MTPAPQPAHTPTPGPWLIASTGPKMRDKYSQPWAVTHGDKQIVCGCFGDIGGEDVAEANARLIASAPDLLAALEKLSGVIHEMSATEEPKLPMELVRAWHKAQAALKKARP